MIEVKETVLKPVEDFYSRLVARSVIYEVFCRLEDDIKLCGYVPDYSEMSFKSYYDKDFGKVVFVGTMKGVIE